MNMSVTCPSKSVERVPRTAMNVSRGRTMNVSMNVSRTVSTTCAPNAYTSRKCWNFIICLSEKSAQTCPRTCPWYSLERVPDILSNVSRDILSNVSTTCPPTCPPACPTGNQKCYKKSKIMSFLKKKYTYPSQTLFAKMTTFKIQILFENYVFCPFFSKHEFRNWGQQNVLKCSNWLNPLTNVMRFETPNKVYD